jgi:hypothetical protein
MSYFILSFPDEEWVSEWVWVCVRVCVCVYVCVYVCMCEKLWVEIVYDYWSKVQRELDTLLIWLRRFLKTKIAQIYPFRDFS